MKFKSFILLIAIFFCFGNTIFSQNLKVQINTGLTKEQFTFTNDNDLCKSMTSILKPNLSVDISYHIKDGIWIQSGFGYHNFYHYIGIYETPPFGKTKNLFSTLSIPVCIEKSFKINKHLHISIISGLSFQYYFNELQEDQINFSGNGFYFVEPASTHIFNIKNSLHQNYNIGLLNKIEASYTTNSNLYFSIYGSFNSGLFDIWHESARFSENYGADIYEPIITSRGSYWNFGIGIGYIFKTKEKQ